MSFDWTEYLHLAQEMAGQAATPSTEEAQLRSAISRAYYALFCKARNHLRDVEQHRIPSDSLAHHYVQAQFRNSRNKTRREIGRNLNRLRALRNQADYDDAVPALLVLTKAVLNLARRSMFLLDNL